MLKITTKKNNEEINGFIYHGEEKIHELIIWLRSFVGLKVITYQVFPALGSITLKLKEKYSTNKVVREFILYPQDLFIHMYDSFIVIDKEDVLPQFNIYSKKG